jgi:hypothetical protein
MLKGFQTANGMFIDVYKRAITLAEGKCGDPALSLAEDTVSSQRLMLACRSIL